MNQSGTASFNTPVQIIMVIHKNPFVKAYVKQLQVAIIP